LVWAANGIANWVSLNLEAVVICGAMFSMVGKDGKQCKGKLAYNQVRG